MTNKNTETFITSLMTIVNDTVKLIENEQSGLKGLHKLGRAIDLISNILISSGLIKLFPEYAIKIIKLLPKIVNFIVDINNDLGVFTHA